MLRRWQSMLVLFGLSGLAVGGDILCGRRLRNYCYLPKYDYQIHPSRKSRVATETSGSVLPDERLVASDKQPDGPRTWRIKQFQFTPTAEVRVDHCSVSQIAVMLVEDGSWSINFLATQNPQSVPIQLQPTVVRFRRNQFHVEVRGVGLAQEVAVPEQPVLGKPAHFRFQVTPFWVEQGQRELIQLKGNSPDVQRLFQQIDRVEIDMSYE